MREPNREYISTSEAARILRVSRITVWNKIEQRKLRAIKVGNRYMIRRSDLAKVAEILIMRRVHRHDPADIFKELKKIF
ncbi:MAG: helix-turn-helix domain-containing protein [Patescibacteria group bacterium]